MMEYFEKRLKLITEQVMSMGPVTSDSVPLQERVSFLICFFLYFSLFIFLFFLCFLSHSHFEDWQRIACPSRGQSSNSCSTKSGSCIEFISDDDSKEEQHPGRMPFI
jgi:hypothetical protein